MRKIMKLWCFLLVVFISFAFGSLLADNQMLQDNLIRVHIVGNSDKPEDQSNKLIVKDAVVAFLQENMQGIDEMNAAKAFLQNNIRTIESVVNHTLSRVNAHYSGRVSVVEEEFTLREYETFSLPSGLYQSLKIELGDSKGKNWWCVAFPAFCVPKTTEDFQSTAIQAGFQEILVDTLSNKNYEIRFFFLDCLGKVKNFFHFA